MTKKALEHGHQVTAYVHKPDAFPGKAEGLSVIVGNLDDKAQIEMAVGGGDQRARSLHDQPQEVHGDADRGRPPPNRSGHGEAGGEAPRHPGHAYGKAKEDPKLLITLMPGVMAKAFFPPAYRDIVGIGPILEASKLDWTIVRIVNPNARHKSDDYGTWIGAGKVKMSVSRENVAACQLECAEKGLYIKRMPVVFNV